MDRKDPTFELALDPRMRERAALAGEFYRVALGPGLHPWFASDEATLYDIATEDEAELIERCRRHYGVSLDRAHLGWPLWRLLDHLNRSRASSGP